MTKLVPPPSFKNIQVSVKPNPDKPGKYDVLTIPPAPQITDADTIINYQIVDTDGYPIVFTGMNVKPHDNDQLSNATVSIDGKMLTFSDMNSVKMTLNINLKFKDQDGVEFAHDPQIQNEPQA